MVQCCLIAVVLLLVLAVSTGCRQDTHPADPGITKEDLGVGIHLGMATGDARSASSGSEITAWVITREELNQRNPYRERGESDLVVALYIAAPADTAQYIPGVSYNTVTELRCYLAAPGSSRVKLMGKPAAELSVADMMALLGDPAGRTEDNNGATHLTFLFAPAEDNGTVARGQLVEVVSSHAATGECFALSFAVVSARPKL